ncbi:MAG TPA: cytochrome P450 [Candidatus Dormibacteraeota bacterium]|nr:cytochrome P450 [Candidatus Dormibacteraeota bacterium]
MVPELLAERSDALVVLPSGPAFAEFQADRLEFFRRCAETAGAVATRLGPDDVIVVSRPELVNDVLVANRADFSKSYLSDLMHPLLAGSLLLADSDSWLRERRLVLPAFHHDRLAGYGDVMRDEAAQMAGEWAGGRRDVHADFMRMTLRVVTRTLFGVDFADGVGVAEGLVSTLMDEFNRRIGGRRTTLPMPSLRFLRVVRALRDLDRIAYRAIEERRRRPAGDLLSMLVEARDENGRPMTDREIRDACIAVFFAGHETTACLLSWTSFVLATRPDVQERVRTELEAAGTDRAPASLPSRTPYTQAVLSEVLRLFPPAYAFGRRAVRATRVGPHSIAAGVTVLMSPWAMHRDPQVFEDPEEFRPERWLDGLASRLPRFAYYPFSSGPRRCVGSSFALMEATVALAVLLPRFELAGAPAKPAAAPSITLRPAGGMHLRVRGRRG